MGVQTGAGYNVKTLNFHVEFAEFDECDLTDAMR